MKRRMIKLLAMGLAVCLFTTPALSVHAEEVQSEMIVEEIVHAESEASAEEEPVQEEVEEEETEATADVSDNAQESEDEAETAGEMEEAEQDEVTNDETDMETSVANVSDLPIMNGIAEDAVASALKREIGADAVVNELEQDDKTGKPSKPSVSGNKVRVVKTSDSDDYKMFTIKESKCVKTNEGIDVTFSIEKYRYTEIYEGYNTDSQKKGKYKANSDNNTEFHFTVPMSMGGKVVPIALWDNINEKWYGDQDNSKQLWMYIPNVSEEFGKSTDDIADDQKAGDDKKNPGSATSEETGAKRSADSGNKETSDTSGQVLPDGDYSVNAETGEKMFKVVDTKLTMKNGRMTALITLSGVGYDYLYMGTKEEAENSDKADRIKYIGEVSYTTDEGRTKTGRQYIIPVAVLDQPIVVASHSEEKNKWYPRTITFSSAALKNEAESRSENETSQKPDDSQTNTPGTSSSDAVIAPDKESNYISDTSGSTGAVDNATTLADGVYTPDSFSFSGGSGKVQITCPKITVSGGQAYATLVFDSSYYEYVKANGNTYNTTKGAGTATVVIPVELNKNNHIIGMTSKMSTNHEINYSIFIYLAAADKDGGNGASAGNLDKQELSKEAPKILGLTYESEMEVGHAELFKVFQYENGIKLLEIDMKKYTKKDGEQQEENKEENKEKKDSSATPKEQAIAELYQGDIVRYLLVPEDAEVPAGLDKEMIVVKLPIDKAYVNSEDEAQILKDLDVLDKVASVGVEKKDCKMKELAEAMDKDKIKFGGTSEKLDYKELVKAETDLIIMPGTILPDAEEKDDQSKEKETKQSDSKDKDSKDTKSTEKEKKEAFEELVSRMAALDIPMLIDRSADEKTEEGKAEWIKLYGALFDKDVEAEALVQKLIEEK